ncbi:MAG TPA: metal ABC transporter ATP-binding protein [Candidatus Acidoferrales bacterium]|nr:metal ABC transporter ATP-binding protein [Candidatus Acidoferrales bacterium]
MPALLTVRDLAVRFGDRVVLEAVNFELAAGEILAVVGPNGSGKTVLLKALLGLIPSTGKIEWAAGTRAGYVPQKIVPDRGLPLRVREVLEAKARFARLPAAEIGVVCETVGLGPELLEAVAGLLSGGQFQKVLIAFALLGHPNIILFDEPTASLDELSEERIYDLLPRLQTESGMTVILVSHDLSVVFRHATKVLCLSRGITCSGPPKEVLTPATLEALYSAPSKYYVHHEEHRRR